MEEREEDVRLGASRYPERYPLGTAAKAKAAHQRKEYIEDPATPLYETHELNAWSFYRAGLTEFMASFLFLYISMLTVIGVARTPNKCSTVGVQGIAWAFGGVMFALVYCTAGISGGHINPAVTFGLFLARKLSLTRTLFYMVMQCLGAICGAGMVLVLHETPYAVMGGGDNGVSHNKVNFGYTKGDGLGAEIMGTFVLVYTVFSAVDAKISAKDSHIPKPRKSLWSKHLGTEGINVLAPLPIGFAVFLVHLATIPITGTGINPARSLGAAIVFSRDHAWIDHWIFWVGPFTGAALAAMYDQVILKEMPFNANSTRRASIIV